MIRDWPDLSGWPQYSIRCIEVRSETCRNAEMRKIGQILRYHKRALVVWLLGTIAMKRKEIILAAMSTAGQKGFRPVHVQKLFFLIDDRLTKETGGPHFAFEPYDYGPFDQDVYRELDRLTAEGLVAVSDPGLGGPRTYWLTEAGLDKGAEALARLEAATQRALDRLTNFVRALSFGDLVSAIYRAYPEMKVNSVFTD